ncbi:hypothetical protein Q4493_09175 [Colwellia sp. 1_MG-2023]|nr:hypothetical protein [Colwellia sp. 1_MG-2023]
MLNAPNSLSLKVKLTCFSLLAFATLIIFVIAQSINFYLNQYELSAMYISFCAGFILFIPLVSLILHPVIYNGENDHENSSLSVLFANAGLVLVIQILFFLIWMTDAVALYSIYVDQNSFLAKAFNIKSENQSDLSAHFYWMNIFLAWLFAWLSLIIGVIPCLIARIDNQGVVKNFVASFSFFKRFKLTVFLSALLIALTTVLSLLYFHYVFLLSFPVTLTVIALHLSQKLNTYGYEKPPV